MHLLVTVRTIPVWLVQRIWPDAFTVTGGKGVVLLTRLTCASESSALSLTGTVVEPRPQLEPPDDSPAGATD